MTPIFITGLDASALQILGQQLGPIGLPTAKALERDPSISLSHWHQRVHATGQNPPARMWDQLAAELFLANMAQAQWCWADPLALPLLDYWAAFDPAIRFVLVAESPLQTALRQQSSQAVETVDTSATPAGVPALATNIALHHWQQTHHALLRFALRHPQRCLLLWQHQTQNPSVLAQALQSRWGLQLTVPGNSGTSAPPSAPIHCALAQHLGQVLTQNHPNAQQLLADLQANVTRLPHTTASSANITSEPHELLARYQQLSELSQQAADIPALKLKIKTQTQKTAEAEKNRADLQVQHANQLSQLQTEHKQALTQAQSQAQEQAKAAKVVSDQQLSEQQKIQTELKQALTQALSQAQEQAKVAKAASDQQQSALQKLQAELKQAQTQAQEQTKAAKAASDQQQSALQKLQAELKQAQTQAQEQTKAAQAHKEQLQQQQKETQEEAALLLNQLHVVQEELENYYYRNKELQAQASALTQLQQRWQQLFTQNRELYAVQNLSIQAHQTGEFVCQLHQLDMAGRHFDQLELSLHLQTDGSTAMVIQRPAEGQGPLLRWPSDIAPGTPLTLQPQLHPDTPPQRVAAFIQLCSSDWQLVQNLHRLLLAALAQGVPTLPAPEQQSLLIALQQSQQHLQGLRHMLRFDAANCPQAPTPEQLHLQLQGVSQQGQHTPQLDLKLQLHSPEHTSLLIGASTLTANGQTTATATQIHLTPEGWYSDGPTPPQLPQLLGQLIGVLPLALVDAVHHGTDKASLKPWANTCRTLRQWPQTPCDPPQVPTHSEPIAPKATAKPKKKPADKVKPKAKAAEKPTAPSKAKATTKGTTKAPAMDPSKPLSTPKTLTPEKTVATSKPTEIPKPTAKAPAKPLAKASVKPAHAPVPHPGRTTSKSRKAVA